MHVQGQNRDQATLFPERLDDLIGEDNAVRVIDAFVDTLDLKALGFADSDAFTCPAGERLAKKTKRTESRHYLYTTTACGQCGIKHQCTAGKQRWVTRHYEEDVLNEVAARAEANPLMMRRRSGMVEHPFGTLKRRMDGGRFLLRGLTKVKAEMALAVTAYNLTRAINVLGVKRLCQALVV